MELQAITDMAPTNGEAQEVTPDVPAMKEVDILGLSCRFPESAHASEFWDNLTQVTWIDMLLIAHCNLQHRHSLKESRCKSHEGSNLKWPTKVYGEANRLCLRLAFALDVV